MNAPMYDERDSFGSIVGEGVTLLRARPGFFIGGVALCLLPTMVLGVLTMATQWEFMTQMWTHLTDVQWQLEHRPGGMARLIQLGSYPVMIVSFAAACAFLARGGLDTLAGTPDGIVGTLSRAARAIPWLATMDTLLVLAIYIGCICCIIPGFVGFVLVGMWFGFQTVILCDEPVNWFDAATRSKEMSRGREGTMIGITATYLGVAFLFGFFMLGVAALTLNVLNGGFDTTKESFSTSAAVAYAIYTLASWLPGTALFSWWMLTRVALYHRLKHPAGGVQQVASVFV